MSKFISKFISKTRVMDKKSRKRNLQPHSLEYGTPACAFIESEIGILPESCLNENERRKLRRYRIKKLVQQTKKDREQHYDIDGVSMDDETIVAGSRAGANGRDPVR